MTEQNSLRKRILVSPLIEWLAGQGEQELKLANLSRGAWPLVMATLTRAASEQGRSVLLLCSEPERVLEQLRPWLGGEPASALFAEVRVNFLDRPPAFDPAVNSRLQALAVLAGDQPALVVSSRRALLRPTLDPSELAAARVVLKTEVSSSPEELAERLVELGYTREALATAPGQFALRGGILDVFPAGERMPVRAEFFGQQIDTLRIYDSENQRSVMPVEEVTIGPGREILIGPERGRRAAEQIRSTIDLSTLRGEVREPWEEEIERVSVGSAFPGVEFFASYLITTRPSLLDHLPPNSLILDLEPERQLAAERELEQETKMLAEAEASDGEFPAGFELPMLSADHLEKEISAWRRVAVYSTPLTPSLPLPARGRESTVDLGWQMAEPVVAQPSALAKLADSKNDTVVLATEQRERMLNLLSEAGVEKMPIEVELAIDAHLPEGLCWADQDIAVGCRNPGLGFSLLTDSELFGRLAKPQLPPSRKAKRSTVVGQLDFAPGDLVVHIDHGIGKFVGMRLLDAEASEGPGPLQREYLELEYGEGDKLFVPVESLDRVQKYLGGGEGQPSLNRLNGKEWERARARANKNAEEVAEELLEIYSRRAAQKGLAFGPDTPWQAEMEDRFPWQETPDQLQAMAEIKQDMEAEQPMDRLICGDVGFGKTELAVRAAFKAVMRGRQVALLAPTTILVQQHFQVFTQRLQGYPLSVKVLSRFVNKEDQQETLDGLKAGTVDIVIGTHRLLQRDVRFKKLGLLVVDEEQRFGVLQKERLKRLRTNVDVLSLSATPIPRTMHMALSSLRDMSVIQTPPEDRQPIKTYVTADDDELVREVIERELARGGQVYYLHNRVRTIDAAAKRIQRLVPEARVSIGHGQMGEQQLAQVMIDFAAHKHDVLVCTTIIESGLDIPNVNTLIVERAEMFGLAQLYQLRGRVGRSGKRAYAYLLYNPKRSLNETADQRLEVMSGLHELGQGFQIALRDLEIRGAGSLLGAEQHGAIAAIGFEMYLQMLQKAVNKLRSGDEEEAVSEILTTPELNLDLPLDHFVPRSYIRDEKLRLGAYRQLAAAENEVDLESVLRSLRDRYGPPPSQLDNLIYSFRVKLKGQRLGLRSVIGDDHEIAIRVDPDRELDIEELERRFAGRLRVRPNRLLLRRQGEGWQGELMRLLDAMAELSVVCAV